MFSDSFPISFGLKLSLDDLRSIFSELGFNMPGESVVKELSAICNKELLSPGELVNLCGLLTSDCILSDDEFMSLYYGLLKRAEFVTHIDSGFKLISLTRSCQSIYCNGILWNVVPVK